MAAASGGPFHDAEVDGEVAVTGCVTYGIEVSILDADALADIVCEQFLLQGRFELRAVGSLDPERVAGNQCFAEGDEVRIVLGGFADPVDDFGQGRITLEPDRCDLAQRDG